MFRISNKVRGKCENRSLFGNRWLGIATTRLFMSPSQDIWYTTIYLCITPYFTIGFCTDALRGPGSARWKS
jgi:hypothetical protein